ncbi:MAG: LPS export ABC transporter periplasmic protein LptC [Parvibaculum sp.]|uniref:LPS export ABC transporter periplasmic protein LptC n=1 Tax=Parvibaculum sp. TaxID=2024848 RepID=UPI001DF4B810|nr:LPS export ABC transporter periplasmic protein LptC [Parvibaculum sp.]MBX3490035.1 LPS export ABC transporter periplasmic protein LptC [Parvibaculum sp.]MBX3496856.1 LPS export ABC transporter periplasmic protein LptC [Parvibaculum sp.]
MSQGSGETETGGRSGRVRPVRPYAAPRAEPPPRSRYSYFVASMKVVLPLGAALLLGVVLYYSGVFSSDDRLDVAFREIENRPDDLRMVSPRIAGVTGDGRPYSVSADNATQDATRPNFVVLENINAELKLDEAPGEEAEWISLAATDGLLDSESQTLELMQSIDIQTAQGYVFHGSRALVDFGAGTVTSDSEVTGEGPLGTLRADRMTADHSGRVMRFEGKVKLLIHPDRPSEGD